MPLKLTLTSLSGGERQERTLSKATLSIGRGSGNDWVLPDPDQHLSRTHCMIGFEQGRKMASLIPGARFMALEAQGHILLSTESAMQVFEAELGAFLGNSGPRPQLSPRQIEVLRGVAHGQTDKQLAKTLQLSPRTVEMHVSGAMKALGCATRAEAVHRAGALGLLQA